MILQHALGLVDEILAHFRDHCRLDGRWRYLAQHTEECRGGHQYDPVNLVLA